MSLDNKEIFSKNLKEHIIRSGKDRKEIAEDLDFPYSTLTEWVNGKKYPRIDRIEKLAEYFGISKLDLIEDFEEIKKDNDRLATIVIKLRTNKELLDIVERISKLNNRQLNCLNDLMDALKQNSKYQI